MNRNQWHAFVDAFSDLEEASRANAQQMMMEKFRHYQEAKRLMREKEDIDDAKNLICDMAGIRRVAPSFHKLTRDDLPLDVVYAEKNGESYNDGLSNSILGRALSGAANLSGLSRVFLDNYHRI